MSKTHTTRDQTRTVLLGGGENLVADEQDSIFLIDCERGISATFSHWLPDGFYNKCMCAGAGQPSGKQQRGGSQI